MKNKINLIGNTFTHTTGGHTGYSVHGKISNYIEWVHDLSADETVYVDQYIFNAMNKASITDCLLLAQFLRHCRPEG